MPAILAVLLVAAITVAVMEFRRADRPEAPTTTAKRADGHQPDVHAAASAAGAGAAAAHVGVGGIANNSGNDRRSHRPSR